MIKIFSLSLLDFIISCLTLIENLLYYTSPSLNSYLYFLLVASLNNYFSPFHAPRFWYELSRVFPRALLIAIVASLSTFLFSKVFYVFCFWQLYIILSFNFSNYLCLSIPPIRFMCRGPRSLDTPSTSIATSFMHPNISLPHNIYITL